MRTPSSRKQKALAEAIRRARELSNKRQSDVARALKLQQPDIARLEKGTRKVTVEEFVAISKALKFDPCEMLKDVFFAASRTRAGRA